MAGSYSCLRLDDSRVFSVEVYENEKGTNMKSLNSMKAFVVVALSIGLFSSTALIPAIAQELPRVYDASMPRDQQITLAESAAPADRSP